MGRVFQPSALFHPRRCRHLQYRLHPSPKFPRPTSPIRTLITYKFRRRGGIRRSRRRIRPFVGSLCIFSLKPVLFFLFFSRHRLVVADSLYSLLPQSPLGLVFSQTNQAHSCGLWSRAFSHSPSHGHQSLTMMLSGTRRAPVPPLSSRRVIDLGVFSCPDSVTTASPRFRSANCCCSFGHSTRCFVSPVSSRAPCIARSTYCRFLSASSSSALYVVPAEGSCSSAPGVLKLFRVDVWLFAPPARTLLRMHDLGSRSSSSDGHAYDDLS
jgi:hypothetical protein